MMNKVYHILTLINVIASVALGCFDYGKDYWGHDLRPGQFKSVGSANACQTECQRDAGCKYWTWVPSYKNSCWLKTGKGQIKYQNGVVSGPKYCGGTPPSPWNPPSPPSPSGGRQMPHGSQGPPGAKLKFDLLNKYQSGIPSYPSNNRIGAFRAVTWPAYRVNNEMQKYVPWAASQDPGSKEITITAKRQGSEITSARLESYQIWTTATSPQTKWRGYVEVRSTLPSKPNGWQYKGSWPAIWLLGAGNGAGWPKHGEIDIVEMVNGNPKIEMTTHSTHRNGGNGQHPQQRYFQANADFTQDPLICGLEWNVHGDVIDLTWWMSWYDLGSHRWEKKHTTLTLNKHGNNDYWDFYKTFEKEGFSLIINLAEGGMMPGTKDVFVDGKPQTMKIKSVKVYGF